MAKQARLACLALLESIEREHYPERAPPCRDEATRLSDVALVWRASAPWLQWAEESEKVLLARAGSGAPRFPSCCNGGTAPFTGPTGADAQMHAVRSHGRARARQPGPRRCPPPRRRRPCRSGLACSRRPWAAPPPPVRLRPGASLRRRRARYAARAAPAGLRQEAGAAGPRRRSVHPGDVGPVASEDGVAGERQWAGAATASASIAKALPSGRPPPPRARGAGRRDRSPRRRRSGRTMHVEGVARGSPPPAWTRARRGACGSRPLARRRRGCPQAGRRADTIGTCHTA